MYKQTDRGKYMHTFVLAPDFLADHRWAPETATTTTAQQHNSNNSDKFVKTSTIATIEVTMLSKDGELDCLI